MNKPELEKELREVQDMAGSNLARLARRLMRARIACQRYPSANAQGEVYGLRIAMAILLGSMATMVEAERKAVIAFARKDMVFHRRFEAMKKGVA